MYPARLFVLLFLLWFEMVQNQCWNGYSVGAVDPYQQIYIIEQPGYDYTQYSQYGYPNTYPQTAIYDYQHYCYPYQDDQQKPVIIVLNNDYHDDDWELYDIISLITSLKDTHDNDPIYIPYPVPVCCNCDYDFEWDPDYYSDYDCRNKKCKSCNDKPYCECGCDDCNKHRKRGRSKSKCRCSDNGRSSSSRGRCNKCDSIKHKCDCCF